MDYTTPDLWKNGRIPPTSEINIFFKLKGYRKRLTWLEATLKDALLYDNYHHLQFLKIVPGKEFIGSNATNMLLVTGISKERFYRLTHTLHCSTLFPASSISSFRESIFEGCTWKLVPEVLWTWLYLQKRGFSYSVEIMLGLLIKMQLTVSHYIKQRRLKNHYFCPIYTGGWLPKIQEPDLYSAKIHVFFVQLEVLGLADFPLSVHMYTTVI